MNDQIIFDRIENCDQIFSPRNLWERKLTILGWCIIVGEVELMRVLLEKGVEVDCSSDAGPPLSFVLYAMGISVLLRSS